MNTRESWDDFFIGIAKAHAARSKDPSTKCGAVIVDYQNRTVSTGYNGPPRGVEDTMARLLNREVKYPITMHAEMNAILFAKRDLSGCRIFSYPAMPCVRCAMAIIQSGITQVIYPRDQIADHESRWAEEHALAMDMLAEAGVLIYPAMENT